MKLYYFTGACALSPHIVALEAGVPVTMVKIDSKTKKRCNWMTGAYSPRDRPSFNTSPI